MLKEDSVSSFTKEEIFDCLLNYFDGKDIHEFSEINKKPNEELLRKRFFVLKTKKYPDLHVSVGKNLQETFKKTELVFENFPKFSCKPIFIIGNDEFQLFGQEFFDGVPIDNCLQSGTQTQKDISNILIDLEKELSKSEEDSDQNNLLAEIHNFEKKILCLPIFTPIDKHLLVNYFFPIFKKKICRFKPKIRLTPGDLAARNIVVNQNGDYRIIDCEFAHKTHFYDGDWIRLSLFSNPQLSSLAFFKDKLKVIDPIMHSYFHFQQLILNKKVHTEDKWRSFAISDLSGFILNLIDEVFKSKDCIILESIFQKQKSLELTLQEKNCTISSAQDYLVNEKKEKKSLESRLFNEQALTESKQKEITNQNELINILSRDYEMEKKLTKLKELELEFERKVSAAKETELNSEKKARTVRESQLISEIEIKSDKISRLETSFSWKITSPFRFFRRLVLDPTKKIFLSRKNNLALNTNDYLSWVTQNDTLGLREEKIYKELLSNLQIKPLISVLMPVYNTPEKFLRIAIESVINQIYLNWELCIADDCSTHPTVRKVLEEYSQKDSRIKIIYRKASGHISEASNTASTLASGDFIAMLDHDDMLREHSLLLTVKAIEENKNVVLLYSDEDKINELDQRFSPFFKPNWNPDLLRSQNYICHMLVIRRGEFLKHKGFRAGYEGSQDWDLLLRLTETLDSGEIVHIPKILYHWRAIENSTALSSNNKEYSTKSSLKALHEHYKRTYSNMSPYQLPNGYFGSINNQKNFPSVTIIIPTRNGGQVLNRCIHSIVDKTAYDNYEIVIIDNNSDDGETLNLLEDFKSKISNLKVLVDTSPFNFSAINNKAAKSVNSKVLVFLNDDTEILEKSWLSELAAHSIRKEIGAVGGKLLYPNGTIQHAGVILGIGGVAGHAFRTFREDYSGQMNRANLIHNVSAVTGACLAIENQKFLSVGGFDEKKLAVAFNDVDICLKLLNKGYRNLYLPQVKLLHHESYSRGMEDNPVKQARFSRETQTMKKRWNLILKNDPCYNPNLTLSDEQFNIKDCST